MYSQCIVVRARSAIVALVLTLLAAACGGGGGGNGDGPDTSLQPVSASVSVTLEVPQALAASAPFDSAKSLKVPPGFGIRLLARVDGARFMALAPNGDVLVSHPGGGSITLLRQGADGSVESFAFASGLQLPHDMVFHRIGDVIYLYLAESNRVTRSIYRSGETQSAEREVVVDNLPDASNTTLPGTYDHQLKNIALSADHKLYVSIASTCNACEEDVTSEPVRGAIYQYNADGSGGRLYARGIRNAEGLGFIPGTNQLWVAINSRDELLYPLDQDITGDGVSDLGQTVVAFVDDNPPDLFTSVRDGGNYGWPYCNPVPNAQMRNLALMRDVQLNADGSKLDCAVVDRAVAGIKAHSAPLGMSFLHGTNVPAAYRRGAVAALHGCWNCSSLNAGYKVVFFPFDAAGNPGTQIDLISGFVTDAQARAFWGRPVDVIADARGNLLISDDSADAIYQLYPR